MLMPKRVKHRKQFRGSMTGKALRGNKIVNGDFGIVAMEPCWIRSNQIEAARIAMNVISSVVVRSGSRFSLISLLQQSLLKLVWVPVRDFGVLGTVVKPGRVLFEISGVQEDVAREALRLATHKLPCKCKIVSRADLESEVAANEN